MAGITSQDDRSHELGMHTEQLGGRTQQVFFSPEDEENFLYPFAFDVDFNKRAEFDAVDMEPNAINLRIRELVASGHGTIVVKNPGAKHSIGVGILNRLNLIFEGSLGYFGVGLIDGPNVRIQGRVGWSCAENMMAGTVVIEKIFQVPGLGYYFVQSALDRDYSMVLGVVTFYASILMLMNLLVDLAYTWLDPRVKLS